MYQQKLLDFLLQIGVNRYDSKLEKTSKNLMVALAILMSLGGLVWGCICVFFGLYLPSLIPFGYVIASCLNMIYFHYSKNFTPVKFFQVLISLALPFFFQWILGGFIFTGVVMWWAVISLIGSMLLYRGFIAYYWLCGFILLTLVSFFWNEHFEINRPPVMIYDNTTLLLTINLILITTIVFFLAKFKIDEDLKLNMKLQEQYEIIQTQNEELYQTQEEILTQREFIQEKNKELNIRNRQINSSIQVAVNIQQVILPNSKKMRQLLGEHFLIYSPKDQVSGDFFWLHRVKGKTFLIVLDCTGHGIPGAFMTLIGHSLLDKIIRLSKITKPSSILYHLHEEVSFMLKQKSTSNHYGMDVAVLSFEKRMNDHYLLEYAGAKLDMFYSLPSTKEIRKIKASRKAIGGIQNEATVFASHQLELCTHTTVYVGSDGLMDQNNLKRKKFGESRLLQLLAQNVSCPMSQQKKVLQATLREFMQGTHQRDDILWIGFKLG